MDTLIALVTESGIVINLIMGLGLICLGLLFIEEERNNK